MPAGDYCILDAFDVIFHAGQRWFEQQRRPSVRQAVVKMPSRFLKSGDGIQQLRGEVSVSMCVGARVSVSVSVSVSVR